MSGSNFEAMDNRQLAEEMKKLPESVIQRIKYLIEDAKLLEDARQAG
jgi:hypothetical protein